MPTGTKTDTAIIAGQTFQKSSAYTNEGQVLLEVAASSLKAGDSGSLTTRTSASAGVITTTAAHGILDTATIDIVWSGGYRYNCDIDSVTSDTITFSGGAGTDLPVQDTAVTACEIVNAALEFDADESDVFAMDSASQNMTLTYKDSGGLVLGVFRLLTTNGYTYIWDSGSGVTNPLTGNAVASVNISCDSTAAKMRFATLKNAL